MKQEWMHFILYTRSCITNWNDGWWLVTGKFMIAFTDFIWIYFVLNFHANWIRNNERKKDTFQSINSTQLVGTITLLTSWTYFSTENHFNCLIWIHYICWLPGAVIILLSFVLGTHHEGKHIIPLNVIKVIPGIMMIIR